MKNKNQLNKTFINQLYDTWQNYKRLYDNSTSTQEANLYTFVMRDIEYLYSVYTCSSFSATRSLFNCAYDVGIDTLC